MAPARISLEQRFWPKVAVTDECWWWKGAKTIASKGSYGVFRISTRPLKSIPAHRYAYEQLVGPIPDGLVLDHLCRNHACVNPSHLEPVTIAENFRRGIGPALRRSMRRCPYGHLYEGDNLYVLKSGSRACRLCAKRRMAEFKFVKTLPAIEQLAVRVARQRAMPLIREIMAGEQEIARLTSLLGNPV